MGKSLNILIKKKTKKYTLLKSGIKFISYRIEKNYD